MPLGDILDWFSALVQSPDFPSINSVADTFKLRYPKPLVENALASVIATTADPKLREYLTWSYLMLANFQPGVGSQGVGPSSDDVKMMAKPLGPPGPGSEQEMRAFAQEFTARDTGRKLKAHEDWEVVVSADRRRLQEKLDIVIKGAAALRDR